MANVHVVHDDRWGSIIDRPDAGMLELRWFDSTAAMRADDFKAWLTTFAEAVERAGRSAVLVDATSFRVEPAYLDGAWRDQHIIPRYARAGVRRFAFHMPASMPAIGKPPAPEGPAPFPTGYFGTREAALAWLAGT